MMSIEHNIILYIVLDFTTVYTENTMVVHYRSITITENYKDSVVSEYKTQNINFANKKFTTIQKLLGS